MQTNEKSILIKIVYADDYSDERIQLIVQRFAKMNNISNYEIEAKQDKELISGFVIYSMGLRFDYSVKGQLGRINDFIKRNRKVVDESEIKENDITNFTGQEIKENIQEEVFFQVLVYNLQVQH